MRSSLNTVRLPNMEEIERLRGEAEETSQEEETNEVDIQEMIHQAKRQCEDMISAAKEQAEDILEQARQDGEKLKAQQSNVGYVEGKTQGEREMIAVLQKHNQEFDKEIQALSSYREQMFDAVKQNVVECLQMLCKKIIFREYDRDDEVINAMIDHFYGMIKERSELVIRVSEEDYSKLNLSAMEKRGISIKIDDTFRHGDLMISCDAQSIDFGLEGQLDKATGAIGVS